MITEKNNVFYCDCGFSFQRGRSGAHHCANGLRNKLAESESRCAALAAENAGLKRFPDQIVSFIGKLGSSEIGRDTKEKIEVAANKVQTPSTDAFLAEVRAQGVDMFALMFAEEAIKSNNITTGWRAKASRAASEYAEALREDAAQFRKGVQS
ncbi:hypothetical protein [Enterobacter chuandaensis]|uniref:Uncharacterized protein n=1 Tax=Enterobacter chuandaensis TaxID=2497875 RepID=A0ABV5A270_9ENTR